MSVFKTPFNRIPKIPRYFNTAMAIVLYALGIYHYTQPNAAWRSGTIETVTATCLLIAAYLVPVRVAIAINVIFALGITALGIRHLSFGGGYISGTIELVFAVCLIIGSFINNKERKSGK
jgi:hypothetical protein